MKRGCGEKKFEICVCVRARHTRTHAHTPPPPPHQELDGEHYRTTPLPVVQPGSETSLRSAINFFLMTKTHSESETVN